MKDNTITAGNGVEIYTHEILRIADEYISELDSPDDMKDANTFLGLLKRIYMELFRAVEPQRYALKTTVDTSDVKLLDGIWDIFCSICYRFKHRPSILKFSVMIGVSRQTFFDWKNGKNRGANPEYIYTIQKWLNESETALEAGAIESNSIGCIFSLKANFSWRETAPIDNLQISETPRQTPEQIAERYQDAVKPDLTKLE